MAGFRGVGWKCTGHGRVDRVSCCWMRGGSRGGTVTCAEGSKIRCPTKIGNLNFGVQFCQFLGRNLFELQIWTQSNPSNYRKFS
jgi:hypothetical protein